MSILYHDLTLNYLRKKKLKTARYSKSENNVYEIGSTNKTKYHQKDN